MIQFSGHELFSLDMVAVSARTVWLGFQRSYNFLESGYQNREAVSSLSPGLRSYPGVKIKNNLISTPTGLRLGAAQADGTPLGFGVLLWSCIPG